LAIGPQRWCRHILVLWVPVPNKTTVGKGPSLSLSNLFARVHRQEKSPFFIHFPSIILALLFFPSLPLADPPSSYLVAVVGESIGGSAVPRESSGGCTVEGESSDGERERPHGRVANSSGRCTSSGTSDRMVELLQCAHHALMCSPCIWRRPSCSNALTNGWNRKLWLLARYVILFSL
jgi:hypothetical protein